MTTIALENVTKEYTDSGGETIVAVDNLSLEIDDGELLVVVGPSGCGKTTTLRMIAGLDMPTSGEIRYDGMVMNDVAARNRDVAMVFQNFALYPHMSARKNMSFGLERDPQGYSDEEIERRVAKAAQMLEIEGMLNQKPANLSGGQQQRVALGRAIVREPQVFLFDEPLANLDEKLQVTMRTEIVELQKQFGVTSVYVTHNQEEAMTVADRIAIMNDGKLQQIDRPESIYREPANLFVAQFIGSPSMNVFEARIKELNGQQQIDTDLFSLAMPDELVPVDLTSRSECMVGIRPEDLSRSSGADGTNGRFEGQVSVVESLGRDALVYTDVGETKVTARLQEYDTLRRGQRLSLAVQPKEIYLFDGETGELLKPKM